MLFDNLVVTHNTGPVVAETHYYPFGLTMEGISSHALKGLNYPENRFKYNGIEQIGDLGLEDYDALFRELDPQIGRWWQIDPKIEEMEMWSPYASNYDNPIKYNDFLGDEPENDPPKGVRGFFISLGGLINGLNHTLTMGTYDVPAERFGLTGDDAAQYNLATNVGEFIPLLVTHAAQPPLRDVLPISVNPGMPARAIPFPTVITPVLPVMDPNRNTSNQKKGPKDLVGEAKALQEKRAKAEERQTKRDNATREGQNKTGQSNQETRGSHASGKSKAKENPHQDANARRAREQKAADEKQKQQKKKNN